MRKSFLSLLLLCFCISAIAEIKLPHIFSDNMIIQRDKPVRIWGSADKNEKIEVSFNGQKKATKANAAGEWSVTLQPMTYGGTNTLTVKGKSNTVTFSNILIGDVWLCSGQSNMEWTVKDVNNAPMEIATAQHPNIRSFNVVKDMATAPKSDLNGSWTVCSPETVKDYSAVGYFFAKELYEKTGIPIGIINSSWGGTDIETWIPESSFKTLPESFSLRYKGTSLGDNFEAFVKENDVKKLAYEKAVNNERGIAEQWQNLPIDATWKSIEVPKIWEETEIGNADGYVWFKYTINIPKEAAGKKATIQLGTIDDNDITWINGVKVGETNAYNANRVYEIPANVIREGANTITVRVYDGAGGGGFYGNPDKLFILSEGQKYPLAGQWKYKASVLTSDFGYVNVSPNMHPYLLYNAMINPLVPFAIKGVTWYQGENNAGEAYKYRTLFPLLINSWREKWNDEFPFYWVQLANFMAEDKQPADSEWAELREAQTLTLSVPHTGQATIIDIGEADDIHPRNKQDVGKRLSLISLNKDYGQKDIVIYGPMFKSMEITGAKAVLSFDYTGGGLETTNKYGYVNGFAIAGADNKFVWAKAYIDGDKVVVYNEKISNPVSVRYAWGNNPDVNLYNKEGLPAVPFRTDNTN